MRELAKAITAELAKMHEGKPVTVATFLHLADRETISRTLCALAKGGEIFRVSRGVYVATIISRFGRYGPGVDVFIEQIANQSGEAIAPFGAFCANALGLTTQVPMHTVYWTSGRTRSYKMGKLMIYFQHAPNWQLVLWNEPPGELVRALAWAGPAEVSKVLGQLVEIVPEEAIRELQRHTSLFPLWLQDALQRVCQPQTPFMGRNAASARLRETAESADAKNERKK